MRDMACPECRRLTSGDCGQHPPVVWYGDGYPPVACCCPVCNGRGKVPNGFYTAIGVDSWTTSSLDPEMCRACEGRGIVWK